MSERTIIHRRVGGDISTTRELGETNGRRNFIDPTLLAEASKTTYADALVAAGVGAGFGLAFLGGGIGYYFVKKGEAEELRAKNEKDTPVKRVVTGADRSTHTPTE